MFFENTERTQQSYLSVRSRLRAFIEEHAGEKWLQGAFAKCGEDQSLHVVSAKKSGQLCPRVSAAQIHPIEDRPANKNGSSLELALDADAAAPVAM